MTAAAENLRASMDDSMRKNATQVAMTDESRRLLTSLMSDEMRLAVAEGIQAAMSEENAQRFVRAVLNEAQRMATAKAGEAAVGVIGVLVKRAVLFLFLGSVVYAIGGWAALASMAKFFGDKS